MDISHGDRKVQSVVSLGGTAVEDVNLGRVKFSIRQAGVYIIVVAVQNKAVKGSPFVKKFLPGKTALHNGFSLVRQLLHTAVLNFRSHRSYENAIRSADLDCNMLSGRDACLNHRTEGRV